MRLNYYCLSLVVDVGLDANRKEIRHFIRNLIRSDLALERYLSAGYRDSRWAESEPTIAVTIPESIHDIRVENPREYRSRAGLIVEIIINSDDVGDDYESISKLLEHMQDRLDDLCELVRERLERGSADDYQSSIWSIIWKIEPVGTKIDLITGTEQSTITGIARIQYDIIYDSKAFTTPEYEQVTDFSVTIDEVQ